MADQRTCDLCGWPIEEWQKAEPVIEQTPDYGPLLRPDILRHANPADHRPTVNPGGDVHGYVIPEHVTDGSPCWCNPGHETVERLNDHR